MRLPGFSAEQALGPAALARGGAARSHRLDAVTPQQDFPPDRERPPLMGCDPESVFEVECAPCRLRLVPGRPPIIGPRFAWRESVRRCVICYDRNGQPYPRCGPCFERACSPFVQLERSFGSINLM